MPYRLTKIYTRKGDKGYTKLGNKPISKDEALIEALGTVDELNSMIGFVISLLNQHKEIEDCLTQIQNDLFDLGGELYLPDHVVITPQKVTRLEQRLDAWNETLPPLEEFLLPRGNPSSAGTHVARTVCRRAERCLVRLHRQTPLKNDDMIRYINRLSDLLFVIARILAYDNGKKELLWNHKK